MARHKIRAHVRADPAGAERRHGGNEPVDHDRAARRRRAEKCAAHGGEIKAADLCEHVESVVSVRRIDRNGFLNDGLFPGERFIRYAAAATRHGLHRRVQQYREHGGGRCRIADAHLADAEHVRVRFRGKLDAGEHRALALLARHGAAAGDILRAVGDLAA